MEVRKVNRERVIEELRIKQYAGKKISYEDLQQLHREYGNGMTEKDFAQNILGVSHSNYFNCKNKGSRVIILKSQIPKVSNEDIKAIIAQLKKEGYENKKISYEKLQQLYKKYGEGLTEPQFAKRVLGITYTNYSSCKKTGTNVIILKFPKRELSSKELQIIAILQEKGYGNKKISYAEFQQLHNEYGREMTEKDFAQNILGISDSAYSNFIHKRTNAVILKSPTEELSYEEIQTIIDSLKEKGYIGKEVEYLEFLKLYNEYGKRIPETEFAEKVLGISYNSYSRCKNHAKTVTIKDGIVRSKAPEIEELYVNQPGFYSKDYISKICVEYDISTEDFITYIVTKAFTDTSHILEAIERNNGLWIGKMRLSEEFVNTNIDLIRKIAERMASSQFYRYHLKGDLSDYIQDTILYILENMGAEEKNYGYNLGKFEEVVCRRIKGYCHGRIIEDLKAILKGGFPQRVLRDGKIVIFSEDEYPDNNVDIETRVLKGMVPSYTDKDSERCILLLREYIEAGCDKNEAIKKTAERMNIGYDKMLEFMEKFISTKKKTKSKKEEPVGGDAR